MALQSGKQEKDIVDKLGFWDTLPEDIFSTSSRWNLDYQILEFAIRFSGCYVTKTFKLLFDKIVGTTSEIQEQNSSCELEDSKWNLEVEVTVKERIIKEKDEEIKILHNGLKERQ